MSRALWQLLQLEGRKATKPKRAKKNKQSLARLLGGAKRRVRSSTQPTTQILTANDSRLQTTLAMRQGFKPLPDCGTNDRS
ncbi:MAG: hypothetical protein HC942_18170 [Microcoleus sp. SU_5_6]|nr:hypothetical protein [Microcoleus sp. SU_5_6]